MTELKLVMNEYGYLFAVLPDGTTMELLADIYGNPFYGKLKVGNEEKEKT